MRRRAGDTDEVLADLNEAWRQADVALFDSCRTQLCEWLPAADEILISGDTSGLAWYYGFRIPGAGPMFFPIEPSPILLSADRGQTVLRDCYLSFSFPATSR